MTLAGLTEHFALGVATPLTAACVIPLYPAFIAYLAVPVTTETDRLPFSGCSLLPVS
ncbi:hypothetical protein [Halovenus salina]|uniref:Uncharacterized protein n=1 Tax=Halovenus salina TaxID=1510225 RepID=A0ABD5W1V2_9EURY